MGKILGFLFGEGALKFVLKLALLGLVLAAFPVAIIAFLVEIQNYIISLKSMSTYVGLPVSFLQAILPSITTALIATILLVDGTIIAFKRVRLFIKTKKDIFSV